MASTEMQSLLSTNKSTSGPKVALHPLVILTISDYIARHTLRNQTGPIIGALLGQQNEVTVTIEHAFEVKSGEDGSIDNVWFQNRLQQMKDVHKNPPLDFVGFYTLCPPSGPTTHHFNLYTHFRAQTSESTTLLLAFHPSLALSKSSSGSLPVSIYDACTDASHFALADGNDGDVSMSDVGSTVTASGHFHELNYSVESGEAERIAVESVARGGGNATTVVFFDPALKETKSGKKKLVFGDAVLEKDKGKGKEKEKVVVKRGEKKVDVQTLLSAEEAEMIASLTAKANAVRMLQSRITLIKKYLESSDIATSSEILRSISALLARLPLVVPASTNASGQTDTAAFEQEQKKCKNDVQLVQLLNKVMEGVVDIRALGKKMQIVSQERMRSEAGDEDEAYVGPPRMAV